MKQFCLTLSRPKHIFLSRLSCNNSRTNNYLSSSAPFYRRCFANSTRLDPSERDSLLESRLTNGSLKHNGNSFMFASWEVVADRDAIRKTFEFTNFNQAWGFMSQAALVAEKMDHHPVEVTLTTHDCEGVSMKDIELAEQMNAIANDVLPTVNDSNNNESPKPLIEDIKIERTKNS